VRKILPWSLQKRPATIFYGCGIVAVGFILDALKQGTFSLGFAACFLPIQRALELGRTAVSLAFTLGRLEGGLQGPIVGYLIDHLGPRLMMAAGFTTTEALKIRAFWQCVLAVGFRNAADTGIIVHLIPILVWKGLDGHIGPWLLGVMALTTGPCASPSPLRAWAEHVGWGDLAAWFPRRTKSKRNRGEIEDSRR
jgi:MFS family permease